MTEQHTPEFNHIQDSAPEYTEEVLWHRVYGAAAAILVILALCGWGLYAIFQGDDERNETFSVDRLAPAAAIPATGNSKDNATDTADNRNLTDLSAASTPTPEPVADPLTIATQQVQTSTLVSPTPAVLEAKPDLPAESAATLSSAAESARSDYPVSISIQHQDITHAALTDALRGLEPARELLSTAELGDGFLKLYFYTDLNGRAGDTLTYSWYRNDKRVARIRIPVGSDRWRSHASKNISATMRGDWKVVVTDRKGETLATSEFKLSGG